MDAATALTNAAREIFAAQHDAMRNVVRGLSAEALNWKPVTDSESNSIATMLSHALDAERFHLAAAADVVVDRDRESHFRVTVASADELLALIDRAEQENNGFLDRVTADRLAGVVQRPGPDRTGAWRLLHAVEHSNEHIGQAQLTRQLSENRSPSV